MTLCDAHILQAIEAKQLAITPWEPILKENRLQPCSVDLLLGDQFGELNAYRTTSFEPGRRRMPEVALKTMVEGSYYLLPPLAFVLGTTREVVSIGGNLRGGVEGKSTNGRCGLIVHCTAGFLDPGFSGQITLEIFNCSPCPIELWPGMPVCQLAITELSGRPNRLYGDPSLGSHYQGQRGMTGPRA